MAVPPLLQSSSLLERVCMWELLSLKTLLCHAFENPLDQVHAVAIWNIAVNRQQFLYIDLASCYLAEFIELFW